MDEYLEELICDCSRGATLLTLFRSRFYIDGQCIAIDYPPVLVR